MKSASSHRCQIPSTFCTPSPNATSPWTHKWSASYSRDVPSCWSSQCFHPRWLSLALVPWMGDVYQEIVVIVEMICDDCSHQQSLFLKTWLLVFVDLDGTWWGQVIGKYGNMIQMKLAIQKLGGAQGSEHTSELNFSYLSLAMLVPRWGSRQETGGRQMVMRQVAMDFNGSKIPRSFPYRPWILNNFDIKVVDIRTPPTFPKNVISVAQDQWSSEPKRSRFWMPRVGYRTPSSNGSHGEVWIFKRNGSYWYYIIIILWSCTNNIRLYNMI